jgi:hypothetical protein
MAGVSVAVSVWVAVGVEVGVEVAVLVKVEVAVKVSVFVAVEVGVKESVLVEVGVGVRLEVAVGVGVGGWGMTWMASTMALVSGLDVPVNVMVMTPPAGETLLITWSSSVLAPTWA